MKPIQITGRLWVLRAPEGELYNDVDTDMIFHNRYLHITDLQEMGQYALDNLKGWESFAQEAQEGDILLAGTNFGAGSSRQQAVDCFRALGVRAIVAESYGAIYKRNAINSGFAVVEVPGLTGAASRLITGHRVTVDLEEGWLTTQDGVAISARPFSQVQKDIYKAGDLFAFGRTATPETLNFGAQPRRAGQGGAE